jgi:septum formation protein
VMTGSQIAWVAGRRLCCWLRPFASRRSPTHVQPEFSSPGAQSTNVILETIRVRARYASPMTTTPLVHLASASPRRSALLQQLGVPHRVRPLTIDESLHPGEAPTDYVRRLSIAKAQALQPALGHAELSLGADTCVALGNDVFGKPADEADCVRILMRLSGTTHAVHTAVTVCQGAQTRTALSTSEVEFRPLTSAECVAYWRSGEPRDKAGGYAIQGRAALFVRQIRGSYTGIVGLPLFETAQLLAAAGIDALALLAGGEA